MNKKILIFILLCSSGNVDTFIYYLYDASGIAGFFVNNTYYYFTKNLFGDIIGIKNAGNEFYLRRELLIWKKEKELTLNF